MKYLKKALALALVLGSISSTTTAFAAQIPDTVPKNSKGVVIQAEEKVWIYRCLPDGTKQKRLWSYTKGIWLTDWMPV